jgi:PPP family 3-phenylpropionic acid transporter
MATGTRLGYAARMAAFFAALFLVIGLQVPYLPLWLDWRGLSATQIGK